MDAACAAGAGGEVKPVPKLKERFEMLKGVTLLPPDENALKQITMPCPYCGGPEFSLLGGLAQHLALVHFRQRDEVSMAMRALSGGCEIVRCACGGDFIWDGNWMEPGQFGAHLLEVIRAGEFTEHFRCKPL